MDRQTGSRLDRALRATRFAVLVAAALLASHDAVYLLHHGAGAEFASAMRNGGHDGYWGAYSVLVVIAAGLAGLATLGRLSALLTRSTSPRRRTPSALPSYRHELVDLTVRLVPAVVAGYLAQENLEHLLTEGRLVGFEPLIGAHLLAIPCVALVASAVAALGALVRWRIRALAIRVPHAHRPARPRAGRLRTLDPWALAAAVRASRWLDLRPEAGRAPPALAVHAYH